MQLAFMFVRTLIKTYEAVIALAFRPDIDIHSGPISGIHVIAKQLCSIYSDHSYGLALRSNPIYKGDTNSSSQLNIKARTNFQPLKVP